ncbi:hypothetical protein J3A84_10965 [Proteiniclasticum sp. SCR006]|uniref:ATP synthase subunit b n=1 Tax=Proteiniclasticum aestuarii TaxID=2817862 RepID=A0A939H7C8_9CLOT|nr:F0F1 ATP synthase subunit delta [Proteiniclasticum aestuarii]MBO1265554.1 hypothetical protein [Proteiniclasticum aestuarii]
MQISLFEIIALIINFFVLLFVLQKLFYKPVTQIMEERQQKIEDNIRNAERKNEEAEALIRTYEKKMSEIEREKSETMSEAVKEAEEYKRNLVEKYEKEAEGKRSAFLADAREDQEAIGAEIRNFMVKGTVDIARNLVDSFKREDLETYLFEALLERIRTFSEENPEGTRNREGGAFTLISASEVDERKKEQLEYVLQENRLESSSLELREDPSLVAGYMLKMPDYTIYSSISHFVDKKEEQLKEFLEQVVRDRGEDYDA